MNININKCLKLFLAIDVVIVLLKCFTLNPPIALTLIFTIVINNLCNQFCILTIILLTFYVGYVFNNYVCMFVCSICRALLCLFLFCCCLSPILSVLSFVRVELPELN